MNKKLYYLFFLWSSFAIGQNWKTISFKENIKFDFPAIHTEKDSSNFKIFSAQNSTGSITVTRTNERSHIFSWDKWKVIQIYKELRDKVLQDFGGELISDEILEFQKLKAAKFVVQKFENSKYITKYYLVFYYKDHIFTFESTQLSNTQSFAGWNQKFYNEINIENNKPAAEVKNDTQKAYINKVITYVMFAALFFILCVAVIICIILWRRYKTENKPSIE